MAVVTRYPSSNTAVSGTWNNPTNAYAANGSVVDITRGTTKNSEDRRIYGNFGFDGVLPSNAVINSVAVEVSHRVQTTSNVCYLENLLRINSTEGAINSDSLEPTTLTARSYTSYARPGGGSWTRADLLDGVLTAVLIARNGNNNTSNTWEWDYVRVVVDYTIPTVNRSAVIATATTVTANRTVERRRSASASAAVVFTAFPGGMIIFASASNANNGNEDTVAITLPSGIAAGDRIFVYTATGANSNNRDAVACSDGSFTEDGALGALAGFPDIWSHFFYKVAAGTEGGATLTFSFTLESSPANVNASVVCVVVRGANSHGWPDPSNWAESHADPQTYMTAPSLTMPSAGFFITFYGADGGESTGNVTADAAQTEIIEEPGAGSLGDARLMVSYEARGAGVTGTRTATLTTGTRNRVAASLWVSEAASTVNRSAVIATTTAVTANRAVVYAQSAAVSSSVAVSANRTVERRRAAAVSSSVVLTANATVSGGSSSLLVGGPAIFGASVFGVSVFGAGFYVAPSAPGVTRSATVAAASSVTASRIREVTRSAVVATAVAVSAVRVVDRARSAAAAAVVSVSANRVREISRSAAVASAVSVSAVRTVERNRAVSVASSVSVLAASTAERNRHADVAAAVSFSANRVLDRARHADVATTSSVSAAPTRDRTRSASVSSSVSASAARTRERRRSAAVDTTVVFSAAAFAGSNVYRSAAVVSSVSFAAARTVVRQRSSVASTSVSFSAGRTRERVRSSTVTSTSAVTASRVRERRRSSAVATVTSVSATRTRVLNRSASSASTVSFSASRLRERTRSSATASVVSVSANRLREMTRSTSAATSVSFTGARQRVRNRSTALTCTVIFTGVAVPIGGFGTRVRVSGSYASVSAGYVKVSGAWKSAEIHVKQAGSWERVL